MASYPPLVHQLIALISWPASGIIAFFAPEPEAFPGAFRLLGEEIAYVALLLLALGLFPLAVRAFARLFVGPRAAGNAAVLAVFLPALSLTAWAFGQLPTVVATVVILFALARGYAFLRGGRWLHLVQAVALAGVAGAAHHGVFLFVPFVGAAVGLRMAKDRGVRRTALRLLLWGVLSAVTIAAILWPFLQWSRGQTLQAPIDHSSRHNFLADPAASWFFFWPMYGPLLFLIPLVLWWGARSRRWWPLLGAFLFLFGLGLGGTTPLPRLIFRSGWEWLTYDRFSFWAALLLLPCAGAVVLQVMRRPRGPGRWAIPLFVTVLIGWASFSGWLSILSMSQPKAVDLAPLVRFLNEPARRPYRYLTLGFGDQLARLSALTGNGSPDGDYHTARELPELRASGLGALDGAVWNPRGAAAVQPILAQPERYGLRWAFVNHDGYLPVLEASGWQLRGPIGDVTLWEYPGVVQLPVSAPAPAGNRLAARWWGSAPLAALVLTLVTFGVARRPGSISREQVIRALAGARGALWAVMVILLSLSWVHVFRPGSLPNLYFTYQSIVVHASDLAAICALGVWATERGLRREPLRFGPKPVLYAGIALIAACMLSALTSQDPALTVVFTAHLALAGGLYLLCLNDPPRLKQVGALFGGLLLGQAVVALTEVGLQSTSWLRGFYLRWPGSLAAADHGASVVQNVAGVRWLRAYGTLPHPNILGGMMLIYLGAVIERFITTGRKFWLMAVALGVMTLGLSFSRSAWLGAGVALLSGVILFPRIHFVRVRRVLLVGAVAAALTALPLLPFFFTRIAGGQGIAIEDKSVADRVLLIQATADVIRARPFFGVGAGTFVESLARLPGQPIPLEPVHNIFLLVTAETGSCGAAALLALGLALLSRMWQRHRKAESGEAVWVLVVLGALTVGLFDHYWWTLPPARLLFGVALGLWAGKEAA